MSMSDIRTEIEFHINVSVSKIEMQESKDMRVVEYKKERQAADFGVLIMKEKGWRQIEPDQDGVGIIASQRLFIFTPNELRDYIDAKLKQKLIDFSERV